jgi:hypothetical protein
MPLNHTDNIAGLVVEVRSFRNQLISKLKASAKADGGALFKLDFVIFLVAKRTLSTAAGFAALVEQHNVVCAAILLRTQIDSLLRLHAFSLVDDPHDLATKIMKGERLEKIKDRTGQQMRDGYLVNTLSKDVAWLKNVYTETSGFVHLSDRLIGLTMDFEGDDGNFTASISETDELNEASWEEIIACFLETSQLILDRIDIWQQIKSMIAAERANQAA